MGRIEQWAAVALIVGALVLHALAGRYQAVIVGDEALVIDQASGGLKSVCRRSQGDVFKNWMCGPAVFHMTPIEPAAEKTEKQISDEMMKAYDDAVAAEKAKLDAPAKPDNPAKNN